MPLIERAPEKTRIQLCGRLSVEIDGTQLAPGLRGKQVPLLLAYLVLNRDRHVGREELMGALWPEEAPRSQDAALRTLLSRLRAALGHEALSGRDELMLNLPEPVWIDVEAAATEMQRAVQTLDRGDFRATWALAQVPLNIASRGLLPGAQATWLEPRRRELEDIRLQALEVIGRAGLGIGGPQLASVERAARTLIDAEPYRESGYVLLMEALAAQGNVAEALRVFERLRSLLREELGTTPSPEALATHQRLLSPHGRAGELERADEAAEIHLPAELLARASTPLVGRRRELGELDRLWSLAAGMSPNGAPAQESESPDASALAVASLTGEGSGPRSLPGRSGRIVVLIGDPGIGKTRLVAELARNVHADGAIVLAGRAPQETLVPYQPFLEALRHYVVNAPSSELRVTTREYGPELARLVPELRRRAPSLAPPPDGEPETERYRLFEAVVGLLKAISEAVPVLLILDDLHWADRPTLLLLRHLARAVDPARLLILGAFRDTEGGDGLSDALSELRREQLVTQIEVGGLNERETAQLVQLRTGEIPSRAFARALHAETDGNPFFIEELVRHLHEAGVHVTGAGARELQRFGLPEGITEVITRRLSRLDEKAIECLRVAAVIGRDFDSALLERIVSTDEDEFLAALDEALAAGLLVESKQLAGRYSFSHALVQETLYEGMSVPRRARIHRRVGAALEASGEDGQLGALAHHFTLAAGAQDAEQAITYAMRAAEQATEMVAHEDAAEHYSRALEVLARFQPDALHRRLELLLLLGEAHVRSGNRAMARPTFREAASLAERLGDGAGLARAAAGTARRYIQEPGVVDEELIEMLDQALEMTAGERTVDRVRLLARTCGAIYYSDESSRMLELSEEAQAIAEELAEPEARALACGARRRALWSAERLQERLECSTQMLTEARRAANLELQLEAHAWLVVDLLERGELDAVEAQMDAFTEGAERLRQPLYQWQAIVWRGMRALSEGRLEDAEAAALEALAAGAPAEAVTAPQYYAIQLLAIRREQLRMGELEPAARELVARNPGRPTWRAALATMLLETERPDEAAAELDRLAERDFTDVPRDGDWIIAMILLGDICSGLGDAARAAMVCEQLEPYADANVVVGLAAVCLGPAARYLGKLAATMGRAEQAERHFERALEASAALGSPLWLAHSQLDFAQAIGGRMRSRRGGDRAIGSGDRATELVQAAARTAEELELPLLARRAQELGAR